MTAHDSTPLLIAVDIGNSRIKLGQFRPAGVTAPEDVAGADEARPALPEPTATLELPLVNRAGQFDAAPLADWCGAGVAGTAAWLVSSVHRGAAEQLATAVGALAKSRGADWRLQLLTYRDVPLRIAVDAPERVGIDRLLAAVAVDHLRRRGRAAIVVDSGTAITVDLVTASGEFAGGAILPGMALSARALEEQTDALPHVAVGAWQTPPRPLGKATVPAIEAGLFWGAVGAIRELVERLSDGLESPPELYLTGGNSHLVAEQLIAADGMTVAHVPHLLLGGIALVARAKATRS
jgi:type III pantothenate kinase